jgi:hypothetical protein
MKPKGEIPGKKTETSKRPIRITGPYWYIKRTNPSKERGRNG